MKANCFECEMVIEGESVEAVVEGFLAHGREQHSWDYPEPALRNYARNVAEAAERLTGATERLDAIGPVTIHEATGERIADWLSFFDHDGFADNAEWAACYCLVLHAPPPPELPERAWRASRDMMVRRLRGGTTVGYLAYALGRPAGWVNASLRSDYRALDGVDPQGPAPASVIGISCFVVAPPFRRHGVAAALLDRVIADAPNRGASWIEGYPHNAPRGNDASHFRGPREMYEARGFVEVERRENDTVLRRAAVA